MNDEEIMKLIKEMPLTPPDSKRKVYAMASFRKGVNVSQFHDNIHIGIVSANSMEDALEYNKKNLSDSGLMVDDWAQSGIITFRFLSDLAPIGYIFDMFKPLALAVAKKQISFTAPDNGVPVFISPTVPQTKLEKSIDEMTSYTRYVFRNATDEEKVVAEKVISNFKDIWIQKQKTI